MTLLASEFDFHLPPDRVAQVPARPREAARLLHVVAGGDTDPWADPWADLRVGDLPGLLRAGDLLVANDTRVIPARLDARRGEARIGITLDRPLPDGGWHALVRNARRLRPGDVLRFEGSAVTVTVVALHEGGSAILRFSADGGAFDVFLREAGQLALPPYIDRPDGPTAADATDYQTMFARHDGAVAAPTAALHFTPALLEAAQAKGVAQATVTLHVGAGTFLPMRHDEVSAHRMHPERGIVTAETAAAVNAARDRGGRVLAVGTTTLRLLETAAGPDGRVHPFNGETDLFILPGHRFRAVDLLLTNFHLPRSTLFMLVCAFAGAARMRGAYAHAVENGYRFYSYGDACLLERTG